MNVIQASLSHIEYTLSIRLPGTYRRIMLDYSFPEDSNTAECLLVNDPERVIAIQDAHPALPGNSFVIGDDDLGEVFFIDLSLGDESPVWSRDEMEDNLVVEIAPDLDAYVIWCWSVEDEIARETKRRRKKWWQFWKRDEGDGERDEWDSEEPDERDS